MNFMFKWQEQYLFLQFHGRNIFNFPFLVTGVKIFFKNLMDANLLAMLLFLTTNETRETNSTKGKGGNRDVIERYDTHKGDIRKIRHSGPG